MRLARKARKTRLISLVPLVDVMLILLVFFMVTSTYLDLDMVPMIDRSDPEAALPLLRSGNGQTASAPLLIRLGADGRAYVRGAALNPASLTIAIKARLAELTDAQIIVLPSAHASVQSLVSLMETASGAGATALRVVRLEEAP